MSVNNQNFYQMKIPINAMGRQSSGIDDVLNLDTDYVSVAQQKSGIRGVVSGAIASFETNIVAPLLKCIAGIEPVQDLHGYANPWPGGSGKNLLNPTTSTGSPLTYGDVTLSTSDDMISLSGTATLNGGRLILILKTIHLTAGTYYISSSSVSGTSPNVVVQTLSGNVYTPIADRVNISFTLSEDSDIVVGFNVVSGTSYSSSFKLQIESGSAATTYEPYSNICPITGFDECNIHVSPTTDAQDGQTYTITFPTPPGTVYGGTLDVVTGLLTVNKVAYACNDQQLWVQGGATTVDFRYLHEFNDRKLFNTSFHGLTCSFMKVDSTSGSPMTARWTSTTGKIFGLRWTAGTLEQVQAAASAGNIVICYELAEPLTYQLTPTEISTLIGENNIWADTGNVSVEYLEVADL